jgi:hypothetical protein
MVCREAREPVGMSMTSASLVPVAFSLEGRDLVKRRARAKQLDTMARRVSGVAVPRVSRAVSLDLRPRGSRSDSSPRSARDLVIARPYPRPWIEQSELTGLSIGGEALIPRAAELARSLVTPTHQIHRGIGHRCDRSLARAVHLTFQRFNDWMVARALLRFLSAVVDDR